MTASVRYRNWWPDFSPKGSFIPRLLREAVGQDFRVVDDPRAHVDFEVHSVFCVKGYRARVRGFREKRSPDSDTRRAAVLRSDYGIDERGPASRHIWYTGENLRPPGDWDLTLSFDVDPLLGANWYLPHWAIRLGDLGGQDPNDRFAATNAVLTQPRAVQGPREGFACLLAGNPHPLRSTLIESLGRVGRVDAFGAAFGKPVSSKMELLGSYRFAIVPENDLYPGYVTEKVIEAWLAGCIPIWWGLDPAGFINPSAVINLADTTLTGLSDIVADLDRDSDRLEAMVRQPILTRPYDFDACVQFARQRILVG